MKKNRLILILAKKIGKNCSKKKNKQTQNDDENINVDIYQVPNVNEKYVALFVTAEKSKVKSAGAIEDEYTQKSI